MDIEKEIFERTCVDFQKLKSYGFMEENNQYYYSKVFLNDFKAQITISKDGSVTGTIYDLCADCEYVPFRVQGQVGEFVSKVREEYKKILIDIRNRCFENTYFVDNQTNRIANSIIKMYHDAPVFPWDSSPLNGVFKNKNNEKWYALIVRIEAEKIDSRKKGLIDIINIKLNPEMIVELQKRDGFYKAYHMNKKNWLTIILDNTLKDEEILEYVKESHKFTETSSSWLIPANPKFYDIIDAFSKTDTMLWKQPGNIHVDDLVYLYMGSPYSAILYKCKVTEIDIPYQYQDENLSMKKVMKIKMIKQYQEDEYPFSKLKAYGVKAIRGPRHVPEVLEKIIN